MIDYIKFEVYGLQEKDLLEHPRLKSEFTTKVNPTTGELKDVSFAEYENLFFHINHRNNLITVKKSLHKFWHGGNYTDYTYFDLLQTIEKLKNDFGIEPKKTRIRWIEFGINVNVGKTPKEVYNGYLEHGRTFFNPMQKRNNTVLGVVCEKSRFKIKVYDKGKQYGVSKELMRFEIAVRKMEQLHKTWNVPIYNLTDLLNVEVWHKLKGVLLQTYDKILKVENVNIKALSPKEKDIFFMCSTPQCLARIKDNYHRNTYRKKIVDFEALQKKYRIDDQTANIRSAIKQKVIQLLKAKECANVPLLKTDETPPLSIEIKTPKCANVPLSKNSKLSPKRTNPKIKKCANVPLCNTVHLNNTTTKENDPKRSISVKEHL